MVGTECKIQCLGIRPGSEVKKQEILKGNASPEALNFFLGSLAMWVEKEAAPGS